MLRVLTRLTPVKSLVNYDIHIEDDACLLEEGCKLSFDMLWCYPETNKSRIKFAFVNLKTIYVLPKCLSLPVYVFV